MVSWETIQEEHELDVLPGPVVTCSCGWKRNPEERAAWKRSLVVDQAAALDRYILGQEPDLHRQDFPLLWVKASIFYHLAEELSKQEETTS